MNESNKLILPCLRGEMGDWVYYVTLFKFKDIAARVSMVPEIHKSEGLSKLIQREVTGRTAGIVEYLKTQEQRFFNSLILGLYGGHPRWHELNIGGTIGGAYNNLENQEYVGLNEEQSNYLSSSLGVLTLDGTEKLFAIDGQHRTKAIKDAVKEKPELFGEEIPVVFVAHKKTPAGEIRTRRLFSTLNRYAKPVSKNEIIAIDEEDNCAIITRNIVENFKLLRHRILFNKTRSVSVSNTDKFTNIIVLYDLVVTLLTDAKVFGVSVSGRDYKIFTHRRQSDEVIAEKQKEIENLLRDLFNQIPALSEYIETGKVDRKDKSTSLLFRPVGQNVLYSVIKVAIDRGKRQEAIDFFAINDFSLENEVWSKVFTDNETGRMKTDKTVQKFAFQLILIHIGIKINLSERDKLTHQNFQIDPQSLELI